MYPFSRFLCLCREMAAVDVDTLFVWLDFKLRFNFTRTETPARMAKIPSNADESYTSEYTRIVRLSSLVEVGGWMDTWMNTPVPLYHCTTVPLYPCTAAFVNESFLYVFSRNTACRRSRWPNSRRRSCSSTRTKMARSRWQSSGWSCAPWDRGPQVSTELQTPNSIQHTPPPPFK